MTKKLITITLIFKLIAIYSIAQDSIINGNIAIKSTIDSTILICCDSLNAISIKYKESINQLRAAKLANEKLKSDILKLNQKILNLELNIETLNENNNSLNSKSVELQKKLTEKEELLQQQAQAIKEKEIILSEKEAIYREAMYSKTIDSIKLASLIKAKDIELDGKIKELKLLEQNIAEKENSIQNTSSELEVLRNKAEKSETVISNLKDKNTALQVALTKSEKDIEQLQQEIGFLKKDTSRLNNDLDNCINKDKKKKVRVVQGIAFKTFRTPQYELAPKDVNNTNVYVINNKNAGNIELDYITGASVKLLNINANKQNTSSDLSLFIGFGGKDLFKNFYLGPNIMFLNVIHLNAGINIREYETLKSGFSEGDIMPLGTPIPTNNSWKINGYIGITLDLNVFASIAKKG